MTRPEIGNIVRGSAILMGAVGLIRAIYVAPVAAILVIVGLVTYMVGYFIGKEE